ncbi:MAG TPA: glycosyltransferase [Phycisphaerae bacterium]|nr:glycosyltransferase [Phycisphaerae bacterium]
MPRLEIHIISLECRAVAYLELLAELNRQIERYHLGGTVEVRTVVDGGEAAPGVKRNALLSTATADYIAGIDDDDRITGDYLCSLLEATAGEPHVVTFQARRTIDGGWPQRIIFDLHQPTTPAEHSDVVLMPANHICCWRREIAQLARHAEDLPYGSDQIWWKALLLAKSASTQARVPRVLYHYRYIRENDGVEHDGDNTREAMRLMGPGGVRMVWKNKETGRLIVAPEVMPVDAEAYERLGEIRLS